MNIYLFKRPENEVDLNEYAGFVVRAQNQDAAIEQIGNNYNTDHHEFNEETYLYDFDISLIASGVVGEPAVLLADQKGESL